jgi:hypothetical protein
VSDVFYEYGTGALEVGDTGYFGDALSSVDMTSFDPSYNYVESGIGVDSQVIVDPTSDMTIQPPAPDLLDTTAYMPDVANINTSGVLAENQAYAPYQLTQESTNYLVAQGNPDVLGNGSNRSVYGYESDYGSAQPGPTITLNDPPGGSNSATSGNQSKSPGFQMGGGTPPSSAKPPNFSLPKVNATIGPIKQVSNPRGSPTVQSLHPVGVPSQTNDPLTTGSIASSYFTGVLVILVLVAFLLYKSKIVSV